LFLNTKLENCDFNTWLPLASRLQLFYPRI